MDPRLIEAMEIYEKTKESTMKRRVKNTKEAQEKWLRVKRQEDEAQHQYELVKRYEDALYLVVEHEAATKYRKLEKQVEAEAQ